MVADPSTTFVFLDQLKFAAVPFSSQGRDSSFLCEGERECTKEMDAGQFRFLVQMRKTGPRIFADRHGSSWRLKRSGCALDCGGFCGSPSRVMDFGRVGPLIVHRACTGNAERPGRESNHRGHRGAQRIRAISCGSMCVRGEDAPATAGERAALRLRSRKDLQELPERKLGEGGAESWEDENLYRRRSAMTKDPVCGMQVDENNSQYKAQYGDRKSVV